MCTTNPQILIVICCIPSHVKNSNPYSQFLRLRRLCSNDSDFSSKSEQMCNFVNKHCYPASFVQAGHHRAQQIDHQSALQTSQRDNNERIPFTLTFHPHNHAVEAYSKQVNNPVLLNALAHDAKLVLTFAKLRKYRDPGDQSRSLIISPVPQPMSSTA